MPKDLSPLEGPSRRQFLQTSLAATGAMALAASTTRAGAAVGQGAKRTAADQVTLGNTGLKLSRLGMGTGSNSGQIQFDLGREGFNSLIRYAYDQGITWFDCSQTYKTFEWMGGAIQGLPRERVFLQSKIPGQPEDIQKAIDRHRQVYNTDYIDSLLVHCMVKAGWTDPWKRILDGFESAKDKGWIRSKGVSCHSLPALRTATASPWVEVQLVRVNPQGQRIDGENESVWSDEVHEVSPVVSQLQAMRAKGRGVIGMKILGNGEFVRAEDREKSIRFAMSRPEIDAVVMGFKSRAEIDEGIQRINRALAEV
ncbi:MAG: aldo/keto reductase [Verrucomicrobiales bacterium]|nr:aldo/keto reductase [Verrucomicrobiales bacterium]